MKIYAQSRACHTNNSWSHSPGPYPHAHGRAAERSLPTALQYSRCHAGDVGWVDPGGRGRGGRGGGRPGKVSPHSAEQQGEARRARCGSWGVNWDPKAASLAKRRPTFRSVSQPACARYRSRRVTPELSLQVHLVWVRVRVGVRVRIRVGVRVRVRVSVGVRVRVRIRVRVLTSASDRNWLSSLVELRV